MMDSHSHSFEAGRRQWINPIWPAVAGTAGIIAFTMFARSAVASAFAAAVAITVVLPSAARFGESRTVAIFRAGFVWLIAWLCLLSSPISWAQWAACGGIVASLAIGVSQASILLGSLAPSVTVIMLLWLSWPIWLAGRLAGHETIVNALVAINPLLSLNGQLLDQAIWTERPLMYQWTALGQDVPFAMPTSIVACVTFHVAIGVVCFLFSRRIKAVPAGSSGPDR